MALSLMEEMDWTGLSPTHKLLAPTYSVGHTSCAREIGNVDLGVSGSVFCTDDASEMSNEARYGKGRQGTDGYTHAQRVGRS